MAVRQPHKFIIDNKLKENAELEILDEESQIIVRSTKKKRTKMSIEELTKGMTQEGVLEDFEEWPPIGQEKLEPYTSDEIEIRSKTNP